MPDYEQMYHRLVEKVDELRLFIHIQESLASHPWRVRGGKAPVPPDGGSTAASGGSTTSSAPPTRHPERSEGPSS